MQTNDEQHDDFKSSIISCTEKIRDDIENIKQAINVFEKAFNTIVNKNQFMYKHFENPYKNDNSLLLYKENGNVLGINAFMGMDFMIDNKTYKIAQSCDTAVVPEARGKGVFSKIIKKAVDTKEYLFIIGFPNEKSFPGFLKMGWQFIGNLRVAVLPLRPFYFITKKTFIISKLDKLYLNMLMLLLSLKCKKRYTFQFLEQINFTEEEFKQINSNIKIGIKREKKYFDYKINKNSAHKFKGICCYQDKSLKGYIIYHINESRNRKTLVVDDWIFLEKKLIKETIFNLILHTKDISSIDFIYVPMLNKELKEDRIWNQAFFITYGKIPFLVSPGCDIDKTLLTKTCLRNLDSDTILNT